MFALTSFTLTLSPTPNEVCCPLRRSCFSNSKNPVSGKSSTRINPSTVLSSSTTTPKFVTDEIIPSNSSPSLSFIRYARQRSSTSRSVLSAFLSVRLDCSPASKVNSSSSSLRDVERLFFFKHSFIIL